MYKPLEAYENTKALKEMTNKEAKEHFNWFISKSDERIQALKELIMEDGYDIQLDCTPESLIPLWGWFETRILFEKKTKEEYRKEVESIPFEFRSAVTIDSVRCSQETLNLSIDIIFYLAQVFIVNSNGNLKWGCRITGSRNSFDKNMPVIMNTNGKRYLNLFQTVSLVLVSKSNDRKDTMRLYDFYNRWVKNLLD